MHDLYRLDIMTGNAIFASPSLGKRRQRAAHPVSQVSRRRELARDLRRDPVVRRQRGRRAAET